MSTGLTESADLVLEDGTGVVGANTYTTIALADAYCTLRNAGPYANWLLANESNKVSALIFAAAYIDERWDLVGLIFEDGDGDPALQQGLHFPVAFEERDARGIEISETVPVQINDAAIEYAARSINATTLEATSLQVDLTSQDDAGREITRKREVVGPLEEETYYDTAGSTKWMSYGTADQIIRRSGLAGSGGNTVLRA